MTLEHLSIRLDPGVKLRADALIPYLRNEYPLLPAVTRQGVLREALLRGLAEMEYKARLKE